VHRGAEAAHFGLRQASEAPLDGGEALPEPAVGLGRGEAAAGGGLALLRFGPQDEAQLLAPQRELPPRARVEPKVLSSCAAGGTISSFKSQ
jgi:hypothetical protein